MEHADMAAALASDLQPRDACPVCAAPLQRMPEAPAAEDLTNAERARKGATKKLRTLQQGAVAAERLIERARRDIEEDEKAWRPPGA